MRKAIVCILMLCVLLAHVPCLGEEMTGVFDFENKTVLLNSGYTMPILGLGTYALDYDTCVNSVMALIENGGRLIDTAYMYGNEEAVGEGVADALDISPKAIAVPDIDSIDGLMHTLFTLEDRKLIRILDADGLICLRAEIFDGGTKAADFEQRLRAWQEQFTKLKAGEITKEDYDRWRYHYPDFDDTRIHTAIPPEEPIKSKRGRKPRAHSVG